MSEEEPGTPEDAFELGFVDVPIRKDTSADEAASRVNGPGYQILHAIAMVRYHRSLGASITDV